MTRFGAVACHVARRLAAAVALAVTCLAASPPTPSADAAPDVEVVVENDDNVNDRAGVQLGAGTIAAIGAAIFAEVIGALASGALCFYGLLVLMREFGVFERLKAKPENDAAPPHQVVVNFPSNTPSVSNVELSHMESQKIT